MPAEIMVTWKKAILKVQDKDELDCTDVWILEINGRTVLRAIEPANGLGEPVSAEDRETIGKALSSFLDTLKS